jgi:hypothetical protein
MVLGFESFKKWFESYADHFVIIGGAACDILMAEDGRAFRATKDIDMVLLAEILSADFGRRFWGYIQEGGYRRKNKSSGETQFYRFIEPMNSEYPHMIELFSRRPESIVLPTDAVLTPIPIDDDISSLSAILMDDEYYEFLHLGRTIVDGIPVLSATHLIPFKAKAWLDLRSRKARGEAVDERHIRKHKNDVFRLMQLLPDETKVKMSSAIADDMLAFFDAMAREEDNLKSLGLPYDKEAALERLRAVFQITS